MQYVYKLSFFLSHYFTTLIGRPSLKFQWNPNRARTEGVGRSLFLTPWPRIEGNPDPIPNSSLYVTLIMLARYILYRNVLVSIREPDNVGRDIIYSNALVSYQQEGGSIPPRALLL